MTSETAFANPDLPPAAGHGGSLPSHDDNVPNTAFSKRFIHTILSEASNHFSDFSASCDATGNAALIEELNVFAEMTSDRSVRDFLRDAKGPCAQALAQLAASMQNHWLTQEHDQCPIATQFFGLFRDLIEDDASSLPFDALAICQLSFRALRCMDPSVLEATCVILVKLAENNALVDELYEHFEADTDLMTNMQFILANSLRPRLIHSLWRLLAVLIEQSDHSGPDASSTTRLRPAIHFTQRPSKCATDASTEDRSATRTVPPTLSEPLALSDPRTSAANETTATAMKGTSGARPPTYNAIGGAVGSINGPNFSTLPSTSQQEPVEFLLPERQIPVLPNRMPEPNPRQQSPSDDSNSAISNCSPCCENRNFKRTFQAVALGQIMSLCLCGTGVGSEFLAKQGFNAPAAQSFLNYFFLAFVYGLIVVFRSGDRSFVKVLSQRGWKYFLLAFIDVQANYLIVYAYQFTNLTSIQLLDCSTIPVVMLLSWLFLSVRYLVPHIVGVAVCLLGIALTIYADAITGKGLEGGSNRMLGDFLCLSATVLYGVANVSEEFLVKQYDRFEYLGLVGIFGSVIAGIQLAIFEHKALATFAWTWPSIGMYLLFTASMFVFYSMVSVVMQRTSALMFNLGVLTADFYSLLAGIFLFRYSFNIFYFISFLVVIVGSVVYSWKPTKDKSREETNLFCKMCGFCCPWIPLCCGECRPKPPYTVNDAQAEHSTSLSMESRSEVSTSSSN